ncbi:peptide ABC transporter substrate-binding protein, partial [Burkholderia multivorans]
MKRRTGIKVAAIAAAGALLLSACSTSTTGGGGGGADGGVLPVGTDDQANVLDPAGAQETGPSFV